MKRQFLFLFFVIALASCNSLAGNTQVTAPAVAESSNQPSSSGTNPGWNKYTNEQVGFSIQYPSDWQVADLPDENQGQMHHIALKGPEGGVELIWGSGLGGACPEGYQPLAVANGNWPACHAQREAGTDQWSLAAQPVVGGTGFTGVAYTNDTTSKSRAVVLQVLSTLSFPAMSAISSTSLSTAAMNCPAAAVGTLPLKDQDNGYCLAYPEGNGVVTPPVAGEVCLVPGGPPYMECNGASLIINVEEAQGRTADQVADAVAVDMNCSGERYNLTLANEPAVVLSECKGQDLSRKVFISHANRLYTLTFDDLSEHFYAQIITSFGFMQ